MYDYSWVNTSNEPKNLYNVVFSNQIFLNVFNVTDINGIMAHKEIVHVFFKSRSFFHVMDCKVF